jgi:hypothetical protein
LNETSACDSSILGCYELVQFINKQNQAQASDQFLATTKLATNKAICLKTKKINKSKMYF